MSSWAVALLLSASPSLVAAQAQVEDPAAVYRIPLDDAPTRGPADALVTIVEVSDFECPFCKRALPIVKRVEQEYAGKVRFAFRHNPLPMHRNAVAAATLAEEARVQLGADGFWAMHDALLEAPSLDRLSLDRLAEKAGLRVDTLQRAMVEGKHVNRLRRDQNLVNGLGARGTPTFFVNGRKIVGAQPFEAFKALIDEELRKAKKRVAGGTAPREVYAKTIASGATAPVLRPAPAAQAAERAAQVSVRTDDPARGPGDAPVTVVLFSDFQCPFCAKVEPTLRELERAFPGKLRIVWKHQPLPFHAEALPAARAAEAARAQSKFWPMHDKLFAGAGALSQGAYAGFARELGLDAARFAKDAASPATAARIAEDQKLAAAAGATGTPTMFVNCRKLVGAQPVEALKPIVAEELRKAEKLAGRGTPPGPKLYDSLCAANLAAAPAAAPARAPTKVAVRPDDPARGPAKAPVEVILFSDFQCPYCAKAGPAVAEVEKQLGEDVRVVWKHLPLPFHAQATPAALAAEAARAQGKFWPMHDRLFAGQGKLSDAAFTEHARALGLDLARFEADRRSSAMRERVQADAAAAAAAGITGTPTFVVNGELIVGTAGLREAVERHRAKAGAKPSPRG